MKPFKVIPAMDLIEGQCVRLTRGDYATKKIYPINPVMLAKSFLDIGLDLLHIVDLDGARTGQPQNLATVEAIAKTGISIELGGGLRGRLQLQQAVDCGVTFLIVGSSLLSDQTSLREWTDEFRGKLVAGIDARNGKMAIHGWEKETLVEAVTIARQIEILGFSRIIYTDIARDGTLAGPNLKQLKEVASVTSLPITCSGGISNLKDIHKVKKLQAQGVSGVIVGKAFYEGNITLEELGRC